MSYTPSFREVMTRDQILSIWTFLYVIDKSDDSINKRDEILQSQAIAKFTFATLTNQNSSVLMRE